MGTIAFDYDGVIVDSLQSAYLVWKRTSEELDAPIKIKTLEQYKQFSKNSVPAMLKDLGLPEENLKENLSKQKEIYLKVMQIHSPKLFSCIDQVLSKLYEKYELIIISGANQKIIEQKLKNYKLNNLFSYVQGIIDFNKVKPNPYHINLAMKKVNVHPEKVIYLGDTIEDIQAARAAGIGNIIACSYGFGSKQDLEKEKPHFIADSPLDILSKIKEIEYAN